MKKYIKFTFIILILFFLSFTINKSYAISSKEEIESFRKYQEKHLQEKLKEEKSAKAIKMSFGGCCSYIDEENGKTHTYINPEGYQYSSNEDEFLIDNIIEETFKEYFNKYLDDNLPDDERLIDYIITNCFIYTRKENYKDGDDIEAKVGVYVFPSSENTIWAKDKEITELKYFENNKEVNLQGYLIDGYYIRLVKENDKYVIKFIDIYPEGYSEFVQKVKEKTGLDLENINYADFTNAKSKTEIIAEAAEKENLESANIDNKEIAKDKISILIASICTVLIVIIISSYSSYLRKRK